jgi:hypothetical protein
MLEVQTLEEGGKGQGQGQGGGFRAQQAHNQHRKIFSPSAGGDSAFVKIEDPRNMTGGKKIPTTMNGKNKRSQENDMQTREFHTLKE